ncbi:jg4398 [Pararge aegeria aegeria]|uniref:acid phosphatase n=1 Tax=Pararge aegeria aegeria TaxID=348720 RepID=A0A8S4QW40_9NEOP|nr:jg4398 [Pararge aegeria aegeria]
MLISEKFDPQEVYVRSTDVDRTLMSAQANLAGMYPPSGDAIWNPNLMWRPIPIHTLPETEDEVLAMKRNCDTYNVKKKAYINTDEYKTRLSKFQGLMNLLTLYTGKKIEDYEDINEIYNTLLVESIHDFTLPKWAQLLYPDKLRGPSCYSFTTATATPIMARLMTGPLLKEIVGKMNTVITKENPNPLKLSIYSGHDFTIGNVLNAMGLYDGNCPVYTATIFFELMQEKSTMNYYVQMVYRNSTGTAEPYILDIPDCGQMCPFDRFVELYSNLVDVDWHTECRYQVNIIKLLEGTAEHVSIVCGSVYKKLSAHLLLTRNIKPMRINF